MLILQSLQLIFDIGSLLRSSNQSEIFRKQSAAKTKNKCPTEHEHNSNCFTYICSSPSGRDPIFTICCHSRLMTIFPMKILLFTDYPHSAQHSVVDQMTIIVDYVSIILPPHSAPAELFIVSSISHITRVNHTSPCYSNSLIAVRSH